MSRSVFGGQSATIPIAGNSDVPREQLTHVGVGDRFALELTEGHDTEYRAKRRTGQFVTAVFHVLQCHPLLGLGDLQDAVGEGGGILQFRTQDLIAEDLVGIIEHTRQVSANELPC